VKQVHAFVETNGAPVINKYRPDNAFPIRTAAGALTCGRN
jgi:hypothetical protein